MKETAWQRLRVDPDNALRRYLTLIELCEIRCGAMYSPAVTLRLVASRLSLNVPDLSTQALPAPKQGGNQTNKSFCLGAMIIKWVPEWHDPATESRLRLFKALSASKNRRVIDALFKDIRCLTTGDFLAIAKEQDGACAVIALDLLAIRAITEEKFSLPKPASDMPEAERGKAGDKIIEFARFDRARRSSLAR